MPKASPLAEIKRPSSFHPTALFLDGHRRPRLYGTCILSQSISLFKYPSELSAKPHRGEASGHLDPRIVQTNTLQTRMMAALDEFKAALEHAIPERLAFAGAATPPAVMVRPVCPCQRHRGSDVPRLCCWWRQRRGWALGGSSPAVTRSWSPAAIALKRVTF